MVEINLARERREPEGNDPPQKEESASAALAPGVKKSDRDVDETEEK
jgi:hypothetical protein